MQRCAQHGEIYPAGAAEISDKKTRLKSKIDKNRKQCADTSPLGVSPPARRQEKRISETAQNRTLPYRRTGIGQPSSGCRQKILFPARFSCPAPVFCATKMAIASAPLSPNELTNPSMRVAAVKAEMQAVPKEFTAPCTSSFPIYRLDCCSADTSPNRTVRDSSPRRRPYPGGGIRRTGSVSRCGRSSRLPKSAVR